MMRRSSSVSGRIIGSRELKASRADAPFSDQAQLPWAGRSDEEVPGCLRRLAASGLNNVPFPRLLMASSGAWHPSWDLDAYFK